jgi:hypothetical protein
MPDDPGAPDPDPWSHESEGIAASAALWRTLAERRPAAGVIDGPVDPRYFRASRTLALALAVLGNADRRGRVPVAEAPSRLRGAWYSPAPSDRRRSS